MYGNGAGPLGQLTARMDELAAAVAAISARIDTQYRRRLLEHDAELEALAGQVEAVRHRLGLVERELTDYRAALALATHHQSPPHARGDAGGNR